MAPEGEDAEEPATLVVSSGAASPPAMSPSERVADDLHHDEIARTKNFAAGSVFIITLGMIAQHMNTSRSWAGSAARVTAAMLCVEAAVVWYLAIKNRYSRPWMIVFGATAVLGSAAIELDVGLFSPVICAAVFGIHFFARARSGPIVWSLILLKTAIYVVCALLITFDVMDDRGHFSSKGVRRSQKLSQTGLVTAVFIAGLLYGRSSRKSAIESLALARASALEMHRREAQLDEARGDLEAVLRAHRGLSGRYTGTRIGDWHVEALIGRGAMGEVYAARHERGTAGAMKLLLAMSLEEPSGRARFVREADVASRLRSTNLAQVLSVGESDEGIPYFVMELLEGEDLASLLRREERLALALVVEMVEDVARGLAVAHEAGIVHRDLKPANIFRARVWKVLDFGVCSEAGSSGTLTADRIVGTPAYMSPEQALGEKVERHADLFALGAVAYRALTGAPPFAGSGAPQLLYAIVHETPVRPTELVPSLPADIDSVMTIALAKLPADRFDDANEMAAAFKAAAAGNLAPALRARAAALAVARDRARGRT